MPFLSYEVQRYSARDVHILKFTNLTNEIMEQLNFIPWKYVLREACLRRLWGPCVQQAMQLTSEILCLNIFKQSLKTARYLAAKPHTNY